MLILLGQGLIIREGLLAFWGVRVNLRGLIIKSFDMGRINFFFFGLDYANYAKKKVIRHSKHFISLLLSHKHKRTIIGSYVVGFFKKNKN